MFEHRRAVSLGQVLLRWPGQLQLLRGWLTSEIDWFWNVTTFRRRSDMADAFGTAIGAASTSTLGMITTALPLVLGVAAAWLGIRVGRKAISKMA